MASEASTSRLTLSSFRTSVTSETALPPSASISGDQFVSLLARTLRRDDRSSFAREADGDRPADPAPSPGYDRDPAFEAASQVSLRAPRCKAAQQPTEPSGSERQLEGQPAVVFRAG